MSKLFGIPVYESKEAGSDIYFMPVLSPGVYVPHGSYNFREMLAAKERWLIEAYTQAVRRGEVAIIRNAGMSELDERK